jgi:hypothetical protein
LDGILHRGRQFAISAPELFEKHVAEAGIRSSDADREHQLLDVVVHRRIPWSKKGPGGRQSTMPRGLYFRRQPTGGLVSRIAQCVPDRPSGRGAPFARQGIDANQLQGRIYYENHRFSSRMLPWL